MVVAMLDAIFTAARIYMPHDSDALAGDIFALRDFRYATYLTAIFIFMML